MHSRLLAVLPYLLYGQALLCCPNSPANLHSRCPVPATHRSVLSCSLSFLPLCLLFRLSCCYSASSAHCLDSPAAFLPLLLAVQTLMLLSRLSCSYPASPALCPASSPCSPASSHFCTAFPALCSTPPAHCTAVV